MAVTGAARARALRAGAGARAGARTARLLARLKSPDRRPTGRPGRAPVHGLMRLASWATYRWAGGLLSPPYTTLAR
eukprot:343327-Prymnesium_polylepis.1